MRINLQREFLELIGDTDAQEDKKGVTSTVEPEIVVCSFLGFRTRTNIVARQPTDVLFAP